MRFPTTNQVPAPPGPPLARRRAGRRRGATRLAIVSSSVGSDGYVQIDLALAGDGVPALGVVELEVRRRGVTILRGREPAAPHMLDGVGQAGDVSAMHQYRIGMRGTVRAIIPSGMLPRRSTSTPARWVKPTSGTCAGAAATQRRSVCRPR